MNCLGVISYYFLRAKGDFKTYVYYYGISLIVASVFVYPLIKNYSFYGAALTYLIIRTGDLGVFYVTLKSKDLIDFFILSFPIVLFSSFCFYEELYFLSVIYLVFLIAYYFKNLIAIKNKFFVK